MITASNTLRALVVYALVLPMALILGFFLATPLAFSTIALVGLVFALLCAPLILKWHYPLLLLVWNTTAVAFFLPGRPQLWLVMAFLSLLLSLAQRTLVHNMKWVHAPSVVLPLMFLAAVILLTAKLTGGAGLALLGDRSVGGKNYLYLFGAVAGCLAMMAHPVPQRRALLFVTLFLLGNLMNLIGSLLPYLPQPLWYVFMMFPVDAPWRGESLDTENISRFFGLGLAAMGLFFYLLARFGIRGLLERGKLHWLLLALVCAAVAAGSGYRSFLITVLMTFAFVFYFEGLVRSKYMAGIVAGVVIGGLMLLVYADRLPLSIQRSLSFLPLPVDPVAQAATEASNRWRIEMWQRVVPDIPRYFWLGKGLALPGLDLELTNDLAKQGLINSQDAAILSGNYHNGPLSVMISFGVWGVLGFAWFLAASIRALYLNHRYGEPELKRLNTFLLAFFLAKTIFFLAVFGDFRLDLAVFTGVVGLGLALNGGIRRPYREPVLVRPVTRGFRHPAQPVAGVAQ